MIKTDTKKKKKKHSSGICHTWAQTMTNLLSDTCLNIPTCINNTEFYSDIDVKTGHICSQYSICLLSSLSTNFYDLYRNFYPYENLISKTSNYLIYLILVIYFLFLVYSFIAICIIACVFIAIASVTTFLISVCKLFVLWRVRVSGIERVMCFWFILKNMSFSCEYIYIHRAFCNLIKQGFFKWKKIHALQGKYDL